ncbi:MAG TPA: S-adenosylmethionine decarboxylase [Polyangiaceae bacterium]|nr:S-adenosylmethionine decarboxylase [Polyangiaceae bacterium]
MTGGIEWLVDAFGCDPERLRDLGVLEELARALVGALGLTVLGAPLCHRFGGPGGVTGLYLLTESHLAWHTYPESALCTLNLYFCRERPSIDWQSLLEKALGARRVDVRVVRRGLPPENTEAPA